MQNNHSIEVQNLVKQFGAIKAVDGISFDVQQGEIFSLLGPNGAGKTTTISMISCLLQPDSGQVLVMGHSTSTAAQQVKAAIGVVPQEIALYEDLSARENLLFWGKMYGLRGGSLKQRVEEGIDLIGLAEHASRRAGKYSGGMKRRLNIGIALLHRPQVIIMDEPTVGIDPQSRRSILDGVRKLNREGATVFYTTHYMEEAAEISDHIAIMDHGQLIALGTHAELIRLVGQQTRIDLTLNAENPAVLTAWREAAGVSQAYAEDGHLTVLAEDSNLVLPRLFESATALGTRITGIEVNEPNLEAVFLHLTGRALRDG